MEMSGQLHASVVLSLGKDPQILIACKVGWVSDSAWSGGEEENVFPCLGRKPCLQRYSNRGPIEGVAYSRTHFLLY